MTPRVVPWHSYAYTCSQTHTYVHIWAHTETQAPLKATVRGKATQELIKLLLSKHRNLNLCPQHLWKKPNTGRQADLCSSVRDPVSIRWGVTGDTWHWLLAFTHKCTCVHITDTDKYMQLSHHCPQKSTASNIMLACIFICKLFIVAKWKAAFS